VLREEFPDSPAPSRRVLRGRRDNHVPVALLRRVPAVLALALAALAPLIHLEMARHRAHRAAALPDRVAQLDVLQPQRDVTDVLGQDPLSPNLKLPIKLLLPPPKW